MTPEQRKALLAKKRRRALMLKQLQRQRQGQDPLVRALQGIERGTAEFDRRMKSMERRIMLLDRVNRARSVALPGAGGEHRVGRNGEKRKFEFIRAVRFALTGRVQGNELEVDIIRQTEKRMGGEEGRRVEKTVAIAGQDSLGGFLVPAEVTSEIIENLRSELVLQAAGVKYLSNVKGSPYVIGKKTQSTSGRWVGEIEPPDESNVAFGQLSMTPKTGAGLSKQSKRLIMMADPSIEQLIKDDLSETLAILFDDAGLHGNGSEFQPLGYSNTPGIQLVEMGVNGGEPTPEKMRAMIAALRESKGLRNAVSPGWVIATTMVTYLEDAKDTDGRPLYKMGQTSLEDDGTPTNLHGYPWQHTDLVHTNLTKGTHTTEDLAEMFFADWASMVIAQWGGMEIEVTDQPKEAFLGRQVWMQAYQDLDVGVRQEEKLAYANDCDLVHA